MSAQVTPRPPTSARRRSHTLRLVAIALSVALVAGLGWATWWWSHPDVVDDFSAGTGLDGALPLERAGVVVNVTLPTDGASRTFTIRHLSAHMDVNTAAATTSFATCRVTGGGSFYIWRLDELRKVCTGVRPVTGSFRFTYPSDRTVIAIFTPTQPGRVHLDRVDMDVQMGRDDYLRRGTDHIRFDDSFRAR